MKSETGDRGGGLERAAFDSLRAKRHPQTATRAQMIDDPASLRHKRFNSRCCRHPVFGTEWTYPDRVIQFLMIFENGLNLKPPYLSVTSSEP